MESPIPSTQVPANSNDNKTIRPVHVDGALYVIIAVAGSCVASMTTDEAVKFISPLWIFWVKFFFEAVGAGALALKTSRSLSYSNSIK